MRMMNQSCGGGNFTCSINDREMSEYIQYRKREDPVDVKSVATVLGEQPNGNIWILNKECYLDEDGSILDPSDSPFYWLSDHISNPAISPAGSSLVVKFPLKTTILHDLISTIFPVMEHNVISPLFRLGASRMSFHYRTILETHGPLSQSSSRLELFCDSGPWPKRQRQNHCSSFRTFTFWRPKIFFYSRGTKESFVSILARQTVPIGLDDPQSMKNISELLVN